MPKQSRMQTRRCRDERQNRSRGECRAEDETRTEQMTRWEQSRRGRSNCWGRAKTRGRRRDRRRTEAKQSKTGRVPCNEREMREPEFAGEERCYIGSALSARGINCHARAKGVERGARCTPLTPLTRQLTRTVAQAVRVSKAALKANLYFARARARARAKIKIRLIWKIPLSSARARALAKYELALIAWGAIIKSHVTISAYTWHYTLYIGWLRVMPNQAQIMAAYVCAHCPHLLTHGAKGLKSYNIKKNSKNSE